MIVGKVFLEAIGNLVNKSSTPLDSWGTGTLSSMHTHLFCMVKIVLGEASFETLLACVFIFGRSLNKLPSQFPYGICPALPLLWQDGYEGAVIEI